MLPLPILHLLLALIFGMAGVTRFVDALDTAHRRDPFRCSCASAALSATLPASIMACGHLDPVAVVDERGSRHQQQVAGFDERRGTVGERGPFLVVLRARFP